MSYIINPTEGKLRVFVSTFSRKWLKHLEKSMALSTKPSLLRVLIATFWPEYLSLGIMLAVMDIGVRIGQPLILGKLLDYFRESTDISREAALCYAGGLVVLTAISAFLLNHYNMNAFHYGMRVRAACCALIYRKVSQCMHMYICKSER